ncbi:response regulator [Paenibacillus sp. LMG 31458]|uniref:Response regulator n=1 Tax=Paenibacillus phytorum TaxID=2654977 RepID=A0ABX1XYM0_9BACL|nr:response regulator transcription factor [Paenibacillus phytorum]NOU72905.1 response regulator [Paenibacillus phytorum]
MKVVIIDDEKAIHLIMKHLLAKIAEVEIVGSFQETTTAFTFLMNNQADLVFMDIGMPRESGLDFAKRLRVNGWQMKLVFVTSHKEYALPAFDVYAYDYIVKPLSQERLRETVQRALSERAPEIDLEKTSPPLVDPLTKRETDIVLAIAEGLSNKEIADRFGLTEGTVKGHVNRSYGKLGITRRVQAVVRLRELKILP